MSVFRRWLSWREPLQAAPVLFLLGISLLHPGIGVLSATLKLFGGLLFSLSWAYIRVSLSCFALSYSVDLVLSCLAIIS